MKIINDKKNKKTLKRKKAFEKAYYLKVLI